MKKQNIPHTKQKSALPKTDIQTQSHFYNSTIAKILLLIAITIIVYSPAMKGEFLWDDEDAIKNNILVTSSDGLSKIWTSSSLNKEESHYWPLVYTVFWIGYHLWGSNTFGYHLVNIFLHSLNAVLLWLLLRRLLIRGAYFAAFLFALHPVHVESVAWIVELKDVLSGMFYLLGFLAYLQFEKTKRWQVYFLALFLFICAMLSKSIVVTFPFAILLYLWWKKDTIRKRDIFHLLPFFIIAIVIATGDVLFAKKQEAAIKIDTPFIERLLIAGRALWFYAEKLFLPINLATVYPKWIISSKSFLNYLFPLSIIAILSLLLAQRKRMGKGAFILVFYYIINLSPVLGIIGFSFTTISYTADRFQYLASIGLIILFTVTSIKIVNYFIPSQQQIVKCIGSILILSILGVLTFQQSMLYTNLETLLLHSVSVNPNSGIAYNNLGNAYAKKGNNKEALNYYSEALRLSPGNDNPYIKIGKLLLNENKIDEALSYYTEAIRINPNNAESHNDIGVAFYQKGKFNEAFTHFKKATEINPSDPSFYLSTAYALFAMGKFQDAIPYLSEAIRINPDYAEAYSNLGFAYWKLKRTEEAIAEYRKALKINPRLLQAAKELAWILATDQNPKFRSGEEAVTLATMVNEETNNSNPEVLDTLASAYAEAGKYEEASKTAQKALIIATQKGKNILAKYIEIRIKLYTIKKPFRE